MNDMGIEDWAFCDVNEFYVNMEGMGLQHRTECFRDGLHFNRLGAAILGRGLLRALGGGWGN